MKSEILTVASKSDVNKTAGAIAETIRQHQEAVIHVIGAGALNQAVKAVATARGYVSPNGYDLLMIPSYTSVTIEGEERTALKLDIFVR